MKRIAIFLLTLLVPYGALAEDDLYGRVSKRLAHDPALAKQLGHPASEMKSVAWMIGTWDIATTVEGKASDKGRSQVAPVLGGVWLEIRDTYPQGNQDISYLTFNPISKRWISMTVDGIGNAVVSTAAKWDMGKLVFVGDVTVVGEKATLRQTFARIGDRAYTISNEERMKDGSWRLLDTYSYTKR
jgi:hypothetical protein